MNPFLLPANERMLKWRELRNSLKGLEEATQLANVAEWWSKSPLVTYSIDWDSPKSWPTPWELLHEGNLCLTAVAYLMEQTLITSGWDPERLRLVVVKDSARQDLRMLLVVDDFHVLNYSNGDVFNVDKVMPECVTLAKYKCTEHGHVEA